MYFSSFCCDLSKFELGQSRRRCISDINVCGQDRILVYFHVKDSAHDIAG